MEKAEIDIFLAENVQEKKENIFKKYEKEILYMKSKNAQLNIILDFLITKDNEISNRYSNPKKYKTGISFLSATIARFHKNSTPKKSSKPTPLVAPREPKKKEAKVAQNELKKEKVTLDNFNDYQPPVSNKYDKYRKG